MSQLLFLHWGQASAQISLAGAKRGEELSEPAISIIRKGEDFGFVFDLGGQPLGDWICTIEVKKFADDTSSITRVIPEVGNAWPGYLTSTETELLDTGLYRLIGVLTNSTTDQERQPLIRLNITESWAT